MKISSTGSVLSSIARRVEQEVCNFTGLENFPRVSASPALRGNATVKTTMAVRGWGGAPALVVFRILFRIDISQHHQ
jgi:hypothetical protein